jgi:prohibitin 2
VIEAEGERDAAIARATGEAEALRLRADALRGNPDLIQLEFAQRLAPTVQTIMLPSDGSFLLDIRQLVARTE